MLSLSRLVLSCVAVLLCAASPAVASYSTEVATDSPSGYWHLETVPPAGTPFASDIGSLGAKFGAPGAISAAGAVGNAAQFDGNQFLAVQATGTSVATVTFEALFQLTALPAAGNFGKLFDSTSNSGNGLILAVNSSGGLGVASQLDGIFGPTGAQLLPDGHWHHVVFSRDATEVLLYLDGAPVWQHAASGAPLVPSVSGVPFHTFAGGPGDSRITGLMDEPALYDHTLSPGRIHDHAFATGGPPPPPPNHPPTCQQATTLVAQGTSQALTANCSDADNDPLTFGLSSLTTQQGGSLSPNPPASVVYSPPSASFTGSDSFPFTVDDGHGAVTFTSQLYVYPTGATADVADAGETVATPAPTPAQPVSAAVTTPSGGVVTILATTASPPSGYELAGTSFSIVAPLESAGSPLLVTLRTLSTDPVIPTRDGQLITASCTGSGAVPDPCIASDTASAGVRTIVVRTIHASVWQLVTPGKPGKGCGDKNHAHLNEGDCKKLK
jgi:hypothetical protein